MKNWFISSFLRKISRIFLLFFVCFQSSANCFYIVLLQSTCECDKNLHLFSCYIYNAGCSLLLSDSHYIFFWSYFICFVVSNKRRLQSCWMLVGLCEKRRNLIYYKIKCKGVPNIISFEKLCFSLLEVGDIFLIGLCSIFWFKERRKTIKIQRKGLFGGACTMGS